MDWNLIMDYIRPELFILIPVLWFIGWLMKNSKKVTDWVIPVVLTAIGMALAVLWLAIVLGEGFIGSVILYGLVQGILVAAVAVLGNEGFKQFTKKRIDDQGGHP